MPKERLPWGHPHYVEAGPEGILRCGGIHLKHMKTPAYISSQRQVKIGANMY